MTTPTHDRHDRQLAKYGVTQEWWDEAWERCGGHCPACSKPFSTTRLPCIDHDHVSGLDRGLLCRDCNTAAGERHDKAQWFRNMADYLDRPPMADWECYVPGSIGEHRQQQSATPEWSGDVRID